MNPSRQNALYNVGDIVKIKSLERLHQDLGDPIQAQCGWAVSMNKYAGGEYEIIDVTFFNGRRGFHYSYKLAGATPWWFSEDTFDDDPICEPVEAGFDISIDDILGIADVEM